MWLFQVEILIVGNEWFFSAFAVSFAGKNKLVRPP
jgi:hypothetical protein